MHTHLMHTGGGTSGILRGAGSTAAPLDTSTGIEGGATQEGFQVSSLVVSG
jgi:hypothetical protein